MLDVGGGSGAYAMAFCRRADGVTATVFDLPNVTPITRGYLARENMQDRVGIVDGDYNADPLPGGYDLVFLSAIVHPNGPAENEALLQKAADAAREGGRVVSQ
ncbi:MAG: methyltransferase domain-containing protein, partial [Deltaproteobacteria bacterium]|nr:methyltransferase domain-containing protein [Deltaproteobacteria bacterium]